MFLCVYGAIERSVGAENEAMICWHPMSYNPLYEQDNQDVDRAGDSSVFRLCDLFFDGARSIPLRGVHGVSWTDGLCHCRRNYPTGGDTACAKISSGVTDSIACSQSPPKSVTFK